MPLRGIARNQTPGGASSSPLSPREQDAPATVFVKICGNASLADARAVAALRPDALGFILWPGSKRYVPPEQLAAWLPQLPGRIMKVGVFVDAAPAEVSRVMAMTGLDVAQLHGRELPADFVAPERRLWKVVHLPRQDQPAGVRDPGYRGNGLSVAGVGDPGVLALARVAGAWPVDALLVDTYSADSPGGTGAVGDWPAAAAFVAAVKKPVLLAGGLTPDNVRAALRAVQPWGADVSSGVESEPGRKDLRKVRDFIAACRTP